MNKIKLVQRLAALEPAECACQSSAPPSFLPCDRRSRLQCLPSHMLFEQAQASSKVLRTCRCSRWHMDHRRRLNCTLKDLANKAVLPVSFGARRCCSSGLIRRRQEWKNLLRASRRNAARYGLTSIQSSLWRWLLLVPQASILSFGLELIASQHHNYLAFRMDSNRLCRASSHNQLRIDPLSSAVARVIESAFERSAVIWYSGCRSTGHEDRHAAI